MKVIFILLLVLPYIYGKIYLVETIDQEKGGPYNAGADFRNSFERQWIGQNDYSDGDYRNTFEHKIFTKGGEAEEAAKDESAGRTTEAGGDEESGDAEEGANAESDEKTTEAGGDKKGGENSKAKKGCRYHGGDPCGIKDGKVIKIANKNKITRIR